MCVCGEGGEGERGGRGIDRWIMLEERRRTLKRDRTVCADVSACECNYLFSSLRR